MVVFNVYESPNASGDRIDRAEKLVFVKDGFHWWAALFPAVWFLIKGLWLEFVAFVAGAGMLAWLFETIGVDSTASGVVFLVVQVLIGFEAGLIYGSSLERRGWQLQGTVTGRHQADCERRFLESWLASQPAEPLPARDGPTLRDQGGSWAQVALQDARDMVARGAGLIGAKV